MLLLGNYIAFTLMLVLSLIVVLTFFVYRAYNSMLEIDPSQIQMNNLILERGDYTLFPTERLLGKKGFIAVLDDRTNTVYNSGPFSITLTAKELSFIPDYSLSKLTSTTELTLPNGEINYQISRQKDGEEQPNIFDTYILDSGYKLIYASGDFISSDLTPTEYQLLSQEYFKDYHVSKYSFQSSENQSYTLLLFQTQDAIFAALGGIGKALSDCALIFPFIYCFMILGFILWLRKKITMPLSLLCNDLNDFQVGSPASVSYRGPKEFQEIFGSFSAMAKRLDLAEKERQSLSYEKQRMLSGIAHDLKTPITVIQGYAKALGDEVIPLDQQKKYLKLIEKKSEELNSSILTFYEYNKLEHPDYQFSLEKTDICNYFRDYVAQKYEELSEDFLLEADIPEIHPMCMIDRTQFRRVFENIVGNAVKHNQQGTTLYFSLRAEEHAVTVSLGDNGTGINPEIAGSIFDPFVVGKASRGGQGSGLGLSIAKRITQAHGGTIVFAGDRPPCKTVFDITLPTV